VLGGATSVTRGSVQLGHTVARRIDLDLLGLAAEFLTE
jgi:hypothetical protein